MRRRQQSGLPRTRQRSFSDSGAQLASPLRRSSMNREQDSDPKLISRRNWLRQSVLNICLLSVASPQVALSAEDDEFLEEIEKAAFQFFWDQVDPHSGLAKDRCRARGSDNSTVGSIAATGFALTALCIGHKRGY